jgi:hypothetical protein
MIVIIFYIIVIAVFILVIAIFMIVLAISKRFVCTLVIFCSIAILLISIWCLDFVTSLRVISVYSNIFVRFVARSLYFFTIISFISISFSYSFGLIDGFDAIVLTSIITLLFCSFIPVTSFIKIIS